jgi:WD40 repeat protein
MQPVRYQYRAFLCYSHHDKASATWFQRSLERKRIGGDLVGRQTRWGAIPPSLRPIFRDEEDFAAGASLGAHTQSALEASEFLIVLCSPQAAKSHHVNEEVRLFKALGRSDRIISIILAGEPTESFPPALKYKVAPNGKISSEEEEPLAADARKEAGSRQRALIKVIAGLLGVDLDEIVERAKREQRRARQLLSASLAAIVVALVTAGYFYYQSESKRHFEAAARAKSDRSISLSTIDDLLRNENLEGAVKTALYVATSARSDPTDQTIDQGVAQLKRMYNLSPLRMVLLSQTEAIRDIVISPKEDRLALVTGGRNEGSGLPADENSKSGAVQLWDVRSGKRLVDLLGNGPLAPTDVLFSGNGELVAVRRMSELIWKIFSAQTGTPIKSPTGSEFAGLFAWVSGNVALIGDGESTKVADVAAGKILFELKIDRKLVELDAVNISPNGTLVAGTIGDVPDIHVWRIADGAYVTKLAANGKGIQSLKFVDDNHILSMSDDGLVRVWNLEDSKSAQYQIETNSTGCAGLGIYVDSVDVNLEKELAIVSHDGCARIWSLKRGTYFKSATIPNGPSSMQFLKGGFILVLVDSVDMPLGAVDGSLSVISADTFRQVAAFKKPDGSQISISPNGWMAIGSHNLAHAYSVRDGRQLAELPTSAKEGISALASGATLAVVGCFDGTARVYEVGEVKDITIPTDLNLTGYTGDARFTPDGDLVVAINDIFDSQKALQKINLRNWPSNLSLEEFRNGFEETHATALIATGGTRAALFGYSPTKSWLVEAAPGANAIETEIRTCEMTGPEFSQSGKRLLIKGAPKGERCQFGKTRIYKLDAANGKVLGSWGTPDRIPTTIDLSPQDDVAAVTFEFVRADQMKNLSLFNEKNPGEPVVAEVEAAQLVTFAKSGKYVLVIDVRGKATLLDGQTGKQAEPAFEIPDANRIRDAALSSDDALAYFATDEGNIYLVEVKDRKNIKRLRELSGQPLSSNYFGTRGDRKAVAFSESSKQLLSAYKNGRVIVWDTETGVPLVQFDVPKEVDRIDWRKDGSAVVVSGGGYSFVKRLSVPSSTEVIGWAERLLKSARLPN